MGHIYREKAEIPIPNTAHVNGSNGQVSVYELDGDGHRTGVRKVIGLATSDTTMHPNDNFCILFPQLWEQYYDEQPVTSSFTLVFMRLSLVYHTQQAFTHCWTKC